MKLVYKILLFIFIGIFIMLLGSCDPVKRVLKDNKKFEKVASEVVKRGYCINDTIIIDSSRVDTFTKTIPVKEIIKLTKNLDTILPSGVKIKLNDSLLNVTCPESQKIIITKYKTSYIRDKKLEDILNNELKACRDSILNLKITIKEKDLDIKNYKFKYVNEKTKFITTILLIVLGLAYYIYKTIKNAR